MGNSQLILDRPLVAFDLETTGLDIKNDRIVEISCVKIHPDGRREVRTRRINPGMPISAEAAAVHGIRDADVADEPRFEQVAGALFDFLQGCDLTGFNLETFDLPLLARELERAGYRFPVEPVRVIDSRRIFMAKEPRTLSAAYRFYCDRELEGAHGAEADALAAADVLLAQVQRYDDLPAEMEALHDFCHPKKPEWLDPDGKILWRGGDAVLGFGKHRHRSLRALATEEPDYLRWILSKDFSNEVVAIVRDALDGRFPQPPTGDVASA